MKDRSTRLEISVTPSESCSCPLKQAVDSGTEVREVRRLTAGNRCVSDIVVSDGSGGSEVFKTESLLENDCFCPVFEDIDVPPRVEDVRGDGVVVSAYVSEDDDAETLLRRLREKAEEAEVLGIRNAEDDTLANLSNLTEKQNETLRKAVVGGYYDDPQRLSLSELADEFGVSKSAVSQRLSRAESKIVVEAFEE